MKNKFQARLLKAMSDKQMTASELSRASGVGKTDISNYVNGVYIAKQNKCYLLARALNVDPGWLMTGDEPITTRMNSILVDAQEELIIDRYRLADDKTQRMIRFLLDIKEME